MLVAQLKGGGVKGVIINTMEKLKSAARELGLELTPARLEQFDSYYRELTGTSG
jgi:hypothetical protein